LWRANAQTVTQEQCQQADAQLNQVYQQLKGTLNDAQKQHLKLAQREWIKKRDTAVAANPGDPQQTLYKETIKRVEELRNIGGEIKPLSIKNQYTEENLSLKNAIEAKSENILNSLKNESRKRFFIYNRKSWSQRKNYLAAIENKNEEVINNILKKRLNDIISFQNTEMQGGYLNHNNLSSTAHSYWDMGSKYGSEGNYEKSLLNYEYAYKILCSDGDYNNASFTLCQIGEIYINQGDYSKALEYFQKSEHINENLEENLVSKFQEYMPEDPRSKALNGISKIYLALGDYDKSLDYSKKAIKYESDKYGADHNGICKSLYNYAEGLTLTGDYKKAEEAMRTALALQLKVLGPKHIGVADAYYSLGLVEKYLKKYNEAKECMLKSINIIDERITWIKRIDKSIYNIIDSEQKKSLAYEVLGDISENKIAYDSYQKALSHQLKCSDENNPRGSKLLFKIARSQYLIGNLTVAHDYSIRAIKSLKNQIPKIILMDEKSQLSWEQKFVHFSIEPCLFSPDEIIEYLMPWKGFVFSSSLQVKNIALKNLADPSMQETILEINSLRNRLSKIAFSTIDKDRSEFSKVAGRIAELQRLLSSRNNAKLSPNYSDVISLEGFTEKRSSNGITLIDFIQFSDPKAINKSKSYGALVLVPGRESKFIRINDTEKIDQAVQGLRQAIQNGDEESFKAFNNSICNLLWHPIETLLTKSCRELVISPDGLLNFLSFASILDSSGKFLSESFQISYVGSPRDLMRDKLDVGSRQIVLFANPDFDRQMNSVVSNSFSMRSASITQSDKIYLSQLPGTEVESNLIVKEGRDSNWETIAYLGADANKQKLMNISKPGILHLATHGFYLNAPQDSLHGVRGMIVEGLNVDNANIPVFKDVDPMRASGIALSGAQTTLKAWADGKVPDDKDDGLITAEEVSGLDLDGTWLVTLSACESGIGEAMSGEGVFGLRRAFLMAGAQNLIMTLWPVSDETTPKIMADFYKEALATHDAAGSLAKVQREWLVKLRDEKGLLAAVRDAGPFAMAVMAKQGSAISSPSTSTPLIAPQTPASPSSSSVPVLTPAPSEPAQPVPSSSPTPSLTPVPEASPSATPGTSPNQTPSPEASPSETPVLSELVEFKKAA
jgi:CHAT domain-containing protein